MYLTDEAADELAAHYATPEPTDPADYEDGVVNCYCTNTTTEHDRNGQPWVVCADCGYADYAGRVC